MIEQTSITSRFMFYNIYSSIDLIVISTDRKSERQGMSNVAACLLNVRLAPRLQNVPIVHGKNVAAGMLLQCVASMFISTPSWLLSYYLHS
jgi:hypothetical protein